MSQCQINGRITCASVSTKTTPPPAQFLLYGCKEHRLTFGVLSDFVAGKHQPKTCKEHKA